MNPTLATQVLIEAINVALLKGCFGLTEATNIVKAIECLSPVQSNDATLTPLPPNFDESSK